MQSRGNIVPDTIKAATEAAKTIYHAATHVAAGVLQSTNAVIATITPKQATPEATAATTTSAPTSATDEPAKPKKKGRIRTDCAQNITASLSLDGETKKTKAEASPYIPSLLLSAHALLSGKKPAKYIDEGIDIGSEMESLEKQINLESASPTPNTDNIDLLQLRKVELVKNQIIEHAARRADLFFLLLIAVYKTNIIAEKDSTIKQHGKGSEARGTQGCHSSLFPSIKLQLPTQSAFSIFSSTKNMPCTLLQGTYFEEALNVTVELPKIVNDFDGHLEGRFQPTTFVDDCVSIINRVAKNEINPIEGMNEYYQIMNEFFGYFSRKHLKRNTKIDNYRAHQKVWEYEREGTFSGADQQTLKIDPAYTNMMLKKNSYRDVWSNDYYFMRIQNEILTTKMEEKSTKRVST